ncbi:putative phosphoglycerate mutase [Roseiarcus fermentans]|uniref:Putative phosphoglycerate mutase n=1 Tax=Roseiarcus fermentans TaxID=1473586 RepID=A0A366F4I9_9HYPH|nr:histidine phosphatase family protein [Roseiarcus fermentans]RBP09066.1 putative phosphoglycerate mutase [Roseiarcus fermentans]
MPSTVTLVRHGETAWSAAGRHTGRTNIPLTPEGERTAARLRDRLAGQTFDRVFSSPLERAARTCALAGFGDRAVLDPDLVEWNYGDYEGRTSREIEAERPGWLVFRDGCPHGEQAADVGARVDRVIDKLRVGDDRVIVFSSAHVLRVLTARWLGLAPTEGRLFKLDTASVSVLGYEHDSRAEPVIALWNEV